MVNICERCFHNCVCDEYNADRDFPHKVCAYHNSHFVDAANVVEVRHGRWMDAESDDGCIVWHCSMCDYPVKTIGGYPIYRHCPMCGARMDKEDEHEAD